MLYQTLGKPCSGACWVIGYISSVELKTYLLGLFGFQTANKPLKSISYTALLAVHIFLLFAGRSHFMLSLTIFAFSFSCWLRQALLLGGGGAGIRSRVAHGLFKSTVIHTEYLHWYQTLFVSLSSTLNGEGQRVATVQPPPKTFDATLQGKQKSTTSYGQVSISLSYIRLELQSSARKAGKCDYLVTSILVNWFYMYWYMHVYCNLLHT